MSRRSSDAVTEVDLSPTLEKLPADNKEKGWADSTSIKSASGSDDKDSTLEKDVNPSKLETNNLDTDGLPVYDWESDEFRDIPEIVRETVSFEDDPTLPTITFRSLLLSSIFIIIGSFVSQLS